jgi:branched-chain amino acid transport system substrate-binding protein
VAAFREATKGGIKVGNSSLGPGGRWDSQSNPNRASQVAKDSSSDKVDLVPWRRRRDDQSSPTQCEIEEQPCVSFMAPWQPGASGAKQIPAASTGVGIQLHLSCWGIEDIMQCSPTCGVGADQQSGGLLFPNDGSTWGDKQVASARA